MPLFAAISTTNICSCYIFVHSSESSAIALCRSSATLTSTEEVDGRNLWHAVHDRLGARFDYQATAEAARYGEPVLIKPRLGQASFRIAVTDIYKRRYAMTGQRTLPVLEAAHIRPYAFTGSSGSMSWGARKRR